MFLVSLLFAAVCALASPAWADTTWVAAGNVSGLWTAEGSPYMIASGHDTVAANDTLDIGPGVTVYFDGPRKLVVNGLLRAVGTAADSIFFTTDTLANPGRWLGLRFISAHDSCRLEYCVIQHGRATGGGDDRYGGGIECRDSSPTISHCRVRYCYAQIDGGGIYCQVNSAPVISNTEIAYNHAEFGGGGGLLARTTSLPTLIGCDIHHNSTPLQGGGLMFRNGSVGTLSDCLIRNNSATVGGGVYSTGTTSSALLTGCTISANSAIVCGGGINAAGSPLQLTRCTISSNASWYAAGVSDSTTGSTLTNCLIVSNTASENGGGLYSASGAATQIRHCTVSGNSAIYGGNFSFVGSQATIENSIASFAPQGSCARIQTSPSLVWSHNDFFGNTGGNFTGTPPPFVGILDTVNYNGDPCDRFGNLFFNPWFVNAPAGNYHLADTSACISGGTPSMVDDDFEGSPRPTPSGTMPDIGTYESSVGGPLIACGALSGFIGPGDVIVPCNISVEAGVTYVIAPGTRFLFRGRFAFTINGRLQAVGTAEDSIVFTRERDEASSDWRGLRLIDCDDSTQLSYVVIEHVRGEGSTLPDACGGVYAESAYFRMDHSTIRDNLSTRRGGGMAIVENSYPDITDCAVHDNSAAGTLFIFGGGVYAEHSAPEFTTCTISANSAQHRGGGVYADSSNLVFTNCVIEGNTAPDGAGVYAEGGSPNLTGCTIQDNTATQSGGGAFVHAHATLSSCFIRDNHAANGGGIYTDFFDVVLDRCVVLTNSATGSGGGIHARTSTPLIRRCTIVANSSPIGANLYLFSASPTLTTSIVGMASTPAVYFENSATSVVRYSDFSLNPGGHFAFHNNDSTNGPAGLGLIDRTNVNGSPCDNHYNIFLDPQFLNAPQLDFHLQETSPCVQAGDPTLPVDPDGTIADIGAFYVAQPVTPPEPFDLLLPANNDTIAADSVQFCWESSRDVDVGDTLHYTLRLATIDQEFSLFVGADTCTVLRAGQLPLGDSVFVAWWVEAHSDYPDTTLTSESIRYLYWFPAAPETTAVGDHYALLPQTFALHEAYPNPFNAQTTIRYDVPATTQVQLDVFDVLGRRVAALVDDVREAGYHSFSFDGSHLSSGIYFVHLAAGEFIASQKIILLK